MKKLISVVSPAHNEEKNIPLMIKEVDKVLSKVSDKYDYEYIIVNDGSTDKTWEAICKASKKDSRIKGVTFSRSFGHQAALTAGLDHVAGDLVIYCDSDLQHPPELFLKMLKEWEKGSLVVHTKRLETVNESAAKKAFSKLFYKVLFKLSDIEIEEGMADFKLLDRTALDYLVKMREKARFLRGMVPWMGYKSSIIEFNARDRIHGKPWYNFRRNLSFAKQGILSSSLKPLKLIGYMGIVMMLTTAIAFVFGLIRTILIQDWYLSPIFLLLLLVMFFIGLMLVSLGVVALYISYIYAEVQGRPLYIVQNKVNL